MPVKVDLAGIERLGIEVNSQVWYISESINERVYITNMEYSTTLTSLGLYFKPI